MTWHACSTTRRRPSRHVCRVVCFVSHLSSPVSSLLLAANKAVAPSVAFGDKVVARPVAAPSSAARLPCCGNQVRAVARRTPIVVAELCIRDRQCSCCLLASVAWDVLAYFQVAPVAPRGSALTLSPLLGALRSARRRVQFGARCLCLSLLSIFCLIARAGRVQHDDVARTFCKSTKQVTLCDSLMRGSVRRERCASRRADAEAPRAASACFRVDRRRRQRRRPPSRVGSSTARA